MDRFKARQLVSGAAIALSAAQLFIAGTGISFAADKAEAKVHCAGVNACKGKSECSSAKNSCTGQNACKGKGWVAMSEKKCVKKGGKVEKS